MAARPALARARACHFWNYALRSRCDRASCRATKGDGEAKTDLRSVAYVFSVFSKEIVCSSQYSGSPAFSDLRLHSNNKSINGVFFYNSINALN
jgi:hypothetical protein